MVYIRHTFRIDVYLYIVRYDLFSYKLSLGGVYESSYWLVSVCPSVQFMFLISSRVFVAPAFSMAPNRDPVFCLYLSSCPFVLQSVNIYVNLNFDPYVQLHFPRTIKATVKILVISLHLGMTTQTAVSIFHLHLHFMVPGRHGIAFSGILVFTV